MSKVKQASLRRRPGFLFYPVPAITECPLCGVGSPHEHNALEEVIFSYGIKKGIASSNKKELSDAELYNSYCLGFLVVPHSYGNTAPFISGLRAVIEAHKKINMD